jgi:hypothetical protein
MFIHVIFPNPKPQYGQGATITHDVKSSDSVENVKQKIQEISSALFSLASNLRTAARSPTTTFKKDSH